MGLSPVSSPSSPGLAPGVISPSLGTNLPLPGSPLSPLSSLGSPLAPGGYYNDCSSYTSSSSEMSISSTASLDTYSSSSDGSSSSFSIVSSASPSTVALSSGSSQCFLSSFPSTAPHSLTSSNMAPGNNINTTQA